MWNEKITDHGPWGKWELFAANEKSTVKLLHIEKGKRLSYQYHKLRSEHWYVVHGSALVTIDEKDLRLNEGGEIAIPIGTKHRAAGLTDVIILEVARGTWDENDIVRLKDDFNRK